MGRNKTFDEQEVLNSAVRLFWERGYNATSMQDLIDKLGISRSSLYDTYGDKRQLYLAALKQYREEWTAKTVAELDAVKEAKTAIKKLLDATVQESLCDEDHKGCFMLNACIEIAPGDEEAAAIIAGNMQMVQDALVRLLQRGQDAGQISKQHTALALARFVNNAISGIRMSARMGGERNAYKDIAKVTLSML